MRLVLGAIMKAVKGSYFQSIFVTLSEHQALAVNEHELAALGRSLAGYTSSSLGLLQPSVGLCFRQRSRGSSADQLPLL